jgi:hypothetical protein
MKYTAEGRFGSARPHQALVSTFPNPVIEPVFLGKFKRNFALNLILGQSSSVPDESWVVQMNENVFVC